MSESYLPTHEWARVEGGLVVIGLSPFAAGIVILLTMGNQLANVFSNVSAALGTP